MEAHGAYDDGDLLLAAMEHSGEMERSQLYGEVMACTYEDVQVMWSMLDKARICSAAAS